MLEIEKFKDNQFNISTDPRHIAKVLELQEQLFGSKEPISAEWELDFNQTHMFNGSEVITNKTLRFKARSFQGEKNELEFINYREWDDINLLVIMSEHPARTINIFQDSMSVFIKEVMVIFRYYAIITASTLTVYFVVFSIFLIKFQVVRPIHELYWYVVHP